MNRDEKPQHSAFELAAELSEATADFLLSEGGESLLSAIPVVGLVSKLTKAERDFRQHVFEQKLKRFLEEPSLLEAAQARKFNAAIFETEERTLRVGHTILNLLDQIIEVEKPAWAAQIYSALLQGRIDQATALRMLHAIHLAAAEDIELLLVGGDGDDTFVQQMPFRLAAVGLFAFGHGGGLGGGVTSIKETWLGLTMKEILKPPRIDGKQND